MKPQAAVVVFSGGQDSTTCLGWALNRYAPVRAVSFLYGQKHSIELHQAVVIAQKLAVPHEIIDMAAFGQQVDSALTHDGDISVRHGRLTHLPASFVPNRNAMFLTFAHALAQKYGYQVLVGGMNQTDYSGYPDCRYYFLRAMEVALNLGSDQQIRLETPLLYLTKAETFALAGQEGVLELVINDSMTCYEGETIRHAWGMGCGICPACVLRIKGWNDYQGGPIYATR